MSKSTLFGLVLGVSLGRLLRDIGIEAYSISYFILFSVIAVLMAVLFYKCKD